MWWHAETNQTKTSLESWSCSWLSKDYIGQINISQWALVPQDVVLG